jgi:hypothetical protein
MTARIAKLVVALGLLAAAGSIASAYNADARSCYCRKGVGGAVYCTCS